MWRLDFSNHLLISQGLWIWFGSSVYIWHQVFNPQTKGAIRCDRETHFLKIEQTVNHFIISLGKFWIHEKNRGVYGVRCGTLYIRHSGIALWHYVVTIRHYDIALRYLIIQYSISNSISSCNIILKYIRIVKPNMNILTG